jgi:hypothetical protein
MTIILPLDPQEEAKLIAAAHAKGLSADELVRTALDKILAEAPVAPESAARIMGQALVEAMQASPYRETNLESARYPLPVRDVVF